MTVPRGEAQRDHSSRKEPGRGLFIVPCPKHGRVRLNHRHGCPECWRTWQRGGSDVYFVCWAPGVELFREAAA